MVNKPKEVPKCWFDNTLATWPRKLRYREPQTLSKAVELVASSAGMLRVTKKQGQALEQIVLNLVFRDAVSEGLGCLHILTASSQGKETIQYKVFNTSGDTLRSIVRSLYEYGLIDYQVGSSYKITKRKRKPGKTIEVTEGNSYTSKIKLKTECKNFLAKLIEISDIYSESLPMMFGGKNQAAKALNFETAKTRRNAVVESYNNLVGETDIRVGDHPLYQPELLVFRKFVNASATMDGRLYGSIIQRLKKEVRRAIRFNGESTVEVDIVSTHTLIAYALEGIDMTKREGFKPVGSDSYGDPYGVGVLMDSSEKEVRNFAKTVINRSFNLEKPFIEDRSEFYKKLHNSLYNPSSQYESDKVKQERNQRIRVRDSLLAEIRKESPHIQEEELYDTLFHRHSKIQKYFGAKSWSLFNMKESAILLEVIDHFNKQNILTLPVHDSVRIAVKYKDELVSVYTRAISKVLRVDFHNKSKLVDIDENSSSLSSAELERELLQTRYIVDW